MHVRRLKTGYFVLEGLNSAASVYYFYYFYFYMEQSVRLRQQGEPLLGGAEWGHLRAFAWGGGRFAQRFGYFTALKIGSAVMAAAIGGRLAIAVGAGRNLGHGGRGRRHVFYLAHP